MFHNKGLKMDAAIENDGRVNDPNISPSQETCSLEIPAQIMDTYTTATKPDHKASPIYSIFEPWFVVMKLFGLFHETRYIVKDERGTTSTSSKTTGLTLSQIYSIFVIFLLSLLLVKTCTTITMSDTFGEVLFLKLMVVLWQLMCGVNCIIFFILCHKADHLPKIYSELQKVQKVWRDGFCLKSIKRNIYLIFVCGFTMMIINICGLLYLIFFETVFDGIAFAPFHDIQDTYGIYMKIGTFILFIFATAAWILPLCFLMSICSVVYSSFNRFNKELEHAVTKTNKLSESIEAWRRKHFHVCKLVNTVDNSLTSLVACDLLINIANSCLALYIIIGDPGTHPVSLFVNVFWLVSHIGTVLLISLVGGYLNHAAHASLDTLHEFELDSHDEINVQVQFFLSKLTGSPIGISAMDMFVIDKPTVLTMFGMIVTYFVLMIQFKMPSVTAVEKNVLACNCTGNL